MCIHSYGDAEYYVKSAIENGYRPGTREHKWVMEVANMWGVDVPISFINGTAPEPAPWTPPPPVSIYSDEIDIKSDAEMARYLREPVVA